jgi:hypothetical protein
MVKCGRDGSPKILVSLWLPDTKRDKEHRFSDCDDVQCRDSVSTGHSSQGDIPILLKAKPGKYGIAYMDDREKTRSITSIRGVGETRQRILMISRIFRARI